MPYCSGPRGAAWALVTRPREPETRRTPREAGPGRLEESSLDDSKAIGNALSARETYNHRL